jgi:hypothetical protein
MSDGPGFEDEPLSEGDAATVEAVSDHIEATLGEIESVFHEKVSPHAHIDLYLVGPTKEVPYRTIVTSGMSERPMPAAPAPEVRFAELFICLPPEWPTDIESLRDERHWWPYRLLKTLARFPHEHDTWLWREHTVPNGDPPEPHAESTAQCGAIVIPPILMPDGFAVLEREDGDAVHFFGILPLHADEMQLKLERDAGALYEAFERADVDLVIDPDRPSAVGAKRRRRFGLF